MNMVNKITHKMLRCFIWMTLIGFISPQISKAQKTASINDKANNLYHEPYRPQIHFSPPRHWINDPNGMVYYAGEYHLFYQYYPDSTVWGPMHWGHAVSKDLIHWENLPIALYPDSLGYIFSGSAVVDKNNTAGFQKGTEKALVAIFTYHNSKTNIQSQAIAFSNDKGRTWKKYAHNPVLPNPGLKDFRDPKVMWYAPEKKWIMTLACGDHVQFYSSPDLKQWTLESKFGQNAGAHGGVWECPDLFSLNDKGKQEWVLIVNVNPGGPNGGSATQYFTGNFDGKTFIPDDTITKWIDYGPDEYAGVTWSNTGNRKIFLGWMSNWQYANVVPTVEWRGAMTISRTLSIKHIGNNIRLASRPVQKLNEIAIDSKTFRDLLVNKSFDLSGKLKEPVFPCRIHLETDDLKDFSLVLSNDLGEKVVIGYDKAQNQYYIDRRQSGKVNFYKGFAAMHTVPRFVNTREGSISLIIDISSVELFAGDGLSVMTEIFFPTKPFGHITLRSSDSILIKKLQFASLKSIWK